MRKIILSVAVSLDGLIEGPNGEYDWCPPPSGDEMEKFMADIDVVFMGRKSYEMAGAFMPDKTTYVFSNSLKSVKEKNVRLLSGDVSSEVDRIRKETGKNIWLWGGANLTTMFLNEGLIDEMWLGIVPIVLGSGKPLFQHINQRSHFQLVSCSIKKGYLSVVLARSEVDQVVLK